MSKRVVIHIVSCVLAGLLVWANATFNTSKARLEIYADWISEKLIEQGNAADYYLSDPSKIARILPESADSAHARAELIGYAESNEIVFLLYAGDTLVFWTNHMWLPRRTVMDDEYLGGGKLETLTNGTVKLIRREVQANGRMFNFVALLPVSFTPPIRADHAQDRFFASPYIPKYLSLSDTGDVEIKDKLGKRLTTLSSSVHIPDWNLDALTLFVFSLLFLALGLLVHHWAAILARDRGLYAGATFLVVVLALARTSIWFFNALDVLANLSLFEPLLRAETLTPSIADLLLNAGMLLWIVLFVVLRFGDLSFEHLNARARLSLAFLVNFLTIWMYLTMIQGIRNVGLLATEAEVDLTTFYRFDVRTSALLLAIVLLAICLYLAYNNRLRVTHLLDISVTQQIGVAVPVLLMAVLYRFFNEVPMPWIGYMFFTLLLLGPDFKVDKKEPIQYSLLVLLIFSLATTSIFFETTNQVSLLRMRDYANALTENTDAAAEYSIAKLERSLQNDDNIERYQEQSFPGGSLPGFEDYVTHLFNNTVYLPQHYNADLWVEVNGNLTAGKDSADAQWKADFATAKAADSTSRIKYFSNDGILTYLYTISLPLHVGNLDTAINLYCRFSRNEMPYSQVYSEFQRKTAFKRMKLLHQFGYALTYKGRVIESSFGNESNSDSLVSSLQRPGIGTETFLYNGQRVCSHKPNIDQQAVVWQEQDVRSNRLFFLTLAAIIYIILFLILVLFSAINYWKTILPEHMMHRISKGWRLNWNFQIAALGINAVTLTMVAVLTAYFLSERNSRMHEEKLRVHLQGLPYDALTANGGTATFSDSARANLQRTLENWADVHQVDINFYDKEGALVAASDASFFEKGFISKRMRADLNFGQPITSEQIFEEAIGSFDYKAAYVPVYHPNSGSLAGYFHLPYYSSDRDEQLQADSLVKRIVTLAMLLFIFMSGVVSIYVSTRITQPIRNIVDRIKEYRLYGRYHPLINDRSDEVGEFLDEYNKLINQLNESTNQIVKAKQGEAWRDMARQVAHEIRNPLTPMKLSIQFLQSFYNRENGEEMVQRVTKTLSEQIETLNRITTEFAHFAKMPNSNNETLVINDVLLHVFELFKEHSEITFSRNIPDEALFVFADRQQLVIAFNNLIKNAVLAMTGERKGEISVTLGVKDRSCLVEIKDNGSGIPDHIKDRIFDPSFTTRTNGNGLGLSITRNILNSFNGDITFETIPDVGTTFFVTIPLSRLPNEPLAE